MATKGQLWVLNRAGRLKLVPEELDPIGNAEADRAIKRSMSETRKQEEQ